MLTSAQGVDQPHLCYFWQIPHCFLSLCRFLSLLRRSRGRNTTKRKGEEGEEKGGDRREQEKGGWVEWAKELRLLRDLFMHSYVPCLFLCFYIRNRSQWWRQVCRLMLLLFSLPSSSSSPNLAGGSCLPPSRLLGEEEEEE